MKTVINLSNFVHSPSITQEQRESLEERYKKGFEDIKVKRINMDSTMEIVDEDQKVSLGYVSTREPDRDLEILLPKGALLDNFTKNPVVLWSHDATKPIGHALQMEVDDYGIKSKTQFDGIGTIADETWQKVKAGTLRTYSVGFIPLKWVESAGRGWKALISKLAEEWNVTLDYFDNVRRIYTSWEMLEYSVVSVPSNASALTDAVSEKSLDEIQEALENGELDDEIEAAFDQTEDPLHTDVEGVPSVSVDKTTPEEGIEVAPGVWDMGCEGPILKLEIEPILELEELEDLQFIELKGRTAEKRTYNIDEVYAEVVARLSGKV